MVLLVNNHVFFHKSHKAGCILSGRNSGDHVSVDLNFSEVLNLLLEVVVLKVVDDTDMVDVLALSTDELVSGSFAGLGETLTNFLESKTGTSIFRAFRNDFSVVWVILDAEEQ
jgi:hypothetical protein